jgi:hypothetical protein
VFWPIEKALSNSTLWNKVEIGTWPQLIIACAVLHNIAKKFGDTDDFNQIPDDDLTSHDNFPASFICDDDFDNDDNNQQANRARGIAKRCEVANFIYNAQFWNE